MPMAAGQVLAQHAGKMAALQSLHSLKPPVSDGGEASTLKATNPFALALVRASVGGWGRLAQTELQSAESNVQLRPEQQEVSNSARRRQASRRRSLGLEANSASERRRRQDAQVSPLARHLQGDMGRVGVQLGSASNEGCVHALLCCPPVKCQLQPTATGSRAALTLAAAGWERVGPGWGAGCPCLWEEAGWRLLLVGEGV